MTHSLLIVEDNADIASLIQLHAKDIDCDSDIACNGKQALEMFSRRLPTGNSRFNAAHK